MLEVSAIVDASIHHMAGSSTITPMMMMMKPIEHICANSICAWQTKCGIEWFAHTVQWCVKSKCVCGGGHRPLLCDLFAGKGFVEGLGLLKCCVYLGSREWLSTLIKWELYIIRRSAEWFSKLLILITRQFKPEQIKCKSSILLRHRWSRFRNPSTCIAHTLLSLLPLHAICKWSAALDHIINCAHVWRIQHTIYLHIEGHFSARSKNACVTLTEREICASVYVFVDWYPPTNIGIANIIQIASIHLSNNSNYRILCVFCEWQE